MARTFLCRSLASCLTLACFSADLRLLDFRNQGLLSFLISGLLGYIGVTVPRSALPRREGHHDQQSVILSVWCGGADQVEPRTPASEHQREEHDDQ